MQTDKWYDGPLEMQKLYRAVCIPEDNERAPFRCPVCQGRQAHVYLHLCNDKTRRGGLWIWCSGCRRFMHGSVYVPEYWVNCPAVGFGRLTAVPVYLEDMKDSIDGHVNSLMNKTV